MIGMRDDPPDNRMQFSVSISGIWNFFKDRRIKRDLNNIKKWKDDYELYNNDNTGTDGGASRNN